MDLLCSAARNWDALTQTHYLFLLGRKNKLYSVDLHFLPEDFSHVAGSHYAFDIDLGLNPNERKGIKFFQAVKNGRITEQTIKKSRNWEKIENRLQIINNLERILESPFTIAEFHPEKVRGYCRIDAKYVIKSMDGDNVFFIFLDEATGQYYCRSAFESKEIDYTENQSIMKTLKITKCTTEYSVTVFSHPRYIEDTI